MTDAYLTVHARATQSQQPLLLPFDDRAGNPPPKSTMVECKVNDMDKRLSSDKSYLSQAVFAALPRPILSENIVAYNQWAKTEDMVASRMRVANTRMTNLQRLVEAQHATNLQQYRQLSNSLDDLYSFTSIVPSALKRIRTFANSLVHIFQLRSAIQETLHGRLSTSLVSHSQMASTMHGINVELSKLHLHIGLLVRPIK